MRLQEYSLHSYRLRYDQPVQWSDIVEEAAPFVLLRLVSDTGAVGVAEITVKPTWCGVTARSLATTIEEVFVPLLRDAELDDPIKVRQLLDRIPENQASKTLIDNACWDLAAAHAGSPLWRLWGGAGRVDLSWAVTRQAPKAMAAEAAAMVSRHGFRTLKIKVGQGFDQDCAALREIRASVGDGVRLYVDANGAYSVEQAADYAKAMADGGAVVIEDPCPLSHRMRGFKVCNGIVKRGCWWTSVAPHCVMRPFSSNGGRKRSASSRDDLGFPTRALCTDLLSAVGVRLSSG